MSSASFGSPSARHRHHPTTNSPNTPAAHGGIGSPNHALLTRNDGGGGGSNSSHSTFQRHHNISHEASPQQRPVPLRHSEVIELTDSDSEGSAPENKKLGKNIPRSGHLQPPFDPIPRSSANNNTTPTSAAAVASSTKFGHRASASPSIASLINGDPPAKKPRTSGAQPTSNFVEDLNGNNSSTSSTNNKRPKKEPAENSPMLKAATTANNNTSTANSSKAPSPKPARQAGSGGGLLGGVLPGMGGGNQEDEFRVPNIYLNFPLDGETNRYIDFAKLAEEKYGWAALNPRLAKAKMMMDSGDEIAVDGSESESNVEMGGTGEAASESSKQRKKRRYQDIYDKEDPFIDDSEMLWEEQAASSKDGFFVYSGPLVPDGEKPQIERADGTVKRGRGRGRGGRGGTTTTRASATTARKPRITKKEKEKLEKEKEERVRYALTAAQSKEAHPH